MAHLSVALCTYNGGSYIRQQLDSLLRQTRLPDELVVCDDGSSDDTLPILTEFQKAAPFQVGLHSNVQRLGVAQNFGRALALVSGDLIALCDQDDEWLPGKLAAAEERFLADPRIEAVFSDGFVVNPILEPMNYTLWRHVGISKVEQRQIMQGQGLEVLLKRMVVTGATLTIRASLLHRALPIPLGWMHDAWLALMASAADGLRAIPTPLFLYRQHNTNQIGARHVSLVERWREAVSLDREAYYRGEIARYQAARERLEEFIEEVRPDAVGLLEAKLRHLEARAQLPACRLLRIGPILAELQRQGYRRYSFGWQVAVKDFLLQSKTT